MITKMSHLTLNLIFSYNNELTKNSQQISTAPNSSQQLPTASHSSQQLPQLPQLSTEMPYMSLERTCQCGVMSCSHHNLEHLDLTRPEHTFEVVSVKNNQEGGCKICYWEPPKAHDHPDFVYESDEDYEDPDWEYKVDRSRFFKKNWSMTLSFQASKIQRAWRSYKERKGNHNNPLTYPPGIFQNMDFTATDYLDCEVPLSLYLIPSPCDKGWDIQGADKEIIQQLFQFSESDWDMRMIHEIRGVQNEEEWILNGKHYHTDCLFWNTDLGVRIHREEVQNPILKESPLKWQESVIQQSRYQPYYYGGFTATLPSSIKSRLPHDVEEALNQFEEDFDFEQFKKESAFHHLLAYNIDNGTVGPSENHPLWCGEFTGCPISIPVFGNEKELFDYYPDIFKKDRFNFDVQILSHPPLNKKGFARGTSDYGDVYIPQKFHNHLPPIGSTVKMTLALQDVGDSKRKGNSLRWTAIYMH